MTAREQFEQFALSWGWNIERCDDGVYQTKSTDIAWGGFEAGFIAASGALPCCGQYEKCTRSCVPRGRYIGQQEAAARIAELERKLEAEIDALKAMIEEMEKQEPVGQFDVDVEGGVSWFLKARKVYDCDKLYLAPGAKEQP